MRHLITGNIDIVTRRFQLMLLTETDTERLSILVMQKFNLKGREREGRKRVVWGADKM